MDSAIDIVIVNAKIAIILSLKKSGSGEIAAIKLPIHSNV